MGNQIIKHIKEHFHLWPSHSFDQKFVIFWKEEKWSTLSCSLASFEHALNVVLNFEWIHYVLLRYSIQVHYLQEFVVTVRNNFSFNVNGVFFFLNHSLYVRKLNRQFSFFAFAHFEIIDKIVSFWWLLESIELIRVNFTKFININVRIVWYFSIFRPFKACAFSWVKGTCNYFFDFTDLLVLICVDIE